MNRSDLHILIAEDELSHSIALRRMLEKTYTNARVEVVTSIRDYRNSMAVATPTIVLLDLNLTDGCTLDLLTEAAETPAFPVIYMSSYASKQVATDALNAGAMDFIIKSPDVFLCIGEIVGKTLREWEQRVGHTAP
ncbi:MAG: response regulator [Desulfuromonadales bacterium]|nr:response regulator [Desulfuromonadales bacterium]